MILKSKIPTVDEQEKKIFIHDAPLLIVLGVLATLFQVVSGWTEYFGLKAALTDNWGETWGKIGAITIATSIELGVMGLVTYIVNGIYDEYLSDIEFTKKQRRANKVKFGGMSIFLFLLICVSMFLSKNNARMALQANPIKPKIEDVSQFDREQEQRTGIVQNRYDTDKTDLSNWQRDSKETIKQRFQTKINTIDEELKIIERKEERTGQRYTTKKATIRKLISTYREQEADELGLIDQQHRTRLNELMLSRDQSIATIEADISRKKDPIIDRNNGIIANNKDYAQTVANFLANYAQFSVVGFLICWSWICVSLNTCGIRSRLFVSKEYFESSLIKELWTLITTTISRPIRNGVRKRLSNIKPLIPLENSEAVYNISDGKGMFAIAQGGKQEQRTIGFKIGQNSVDGKSSNGKNSEPIVVEKIVEKIVYADQDIKYCVHCGASFTYKNKKKKYCSEKCRQEYWENKNGKKLKRGRVKD